MHCCLPRLVASVSKSVIIFTVSALPVLDVVTNSMVCDLPGLPGKALSLWGPSVGAYCTILQLRAPMDLS